MPLEFHAATLPPLRDFSAVAPGGAVIGLVGGKDSGVTELLRLAGGAAAPAAGEVSGGATRRYVAAGELTSIAPAAVLALDHAFALQDPAARIRTWIGLERLRQAGSVVLLSSHEPDLLAQVCDEIWWLEDGRLVLRGDPREVLPRFRDAVAAAVREWGGAMPPRLAARLRRGDGRAEILNLEVLGASGAPTIVLRSGEETRIRVTVQFHEALADPVLGILLRTRIGMEVYGTNSQLENLPLGPVAAGATLTVDFAFRCDLCPNHYTVTAASHDPDGTAHDWLDDAVAFTVVDARATAGVANLRARMSVAGGAGPA
jgi:lipopolysaccharide transport system ATP-binding protein